MRNPEKILNILVENSQKDEYKFERLYRNLYNTEFYLLAYDRIYAKAGNMTKGTDGKTIDGTSIERIQKIIDKIKDESYQPSPAKRVYIPKKNGKKRPLGIPSFDDKLVQQVIKMILESIYENKFADSSHGFRPNRSCHSALNRTQVYFTKIKWFIEGDIKGFFDNISHQKMIEILRKDIKDEKFLRLIWKFLRAGYMEDWKYNHSYSGTPQGGIISPILANIYLNELDKFMESLKSEFDKGKVRKHNVTYHNIDCKKIYLMKKLRTKYNELNEEQKNDLKTKIKSLNIEMKKLPSKDPMDKNYRRLQYVRYADDFLVGIIGSKEDAIGIKHKIRDFLQTELNLELSEDKTLITYGYNKAKFLGYEISVDKNKREVKYSDGRISKVYGAIRLEVPKEAWVNKLIKLKVIDTDSMQGNEEWKGCINTDILKCDDLEIIEWYNAELRGMYNYYKLANNVSVLNKFHYIMERSFIKTLCCKYREYSRRKILNRYMINGRLCVKYKDKNGYDKIRYFVEKSYTRQKYTVKSSNTDVDKTPVPIHLARTSLISRLEANKCEICGRENVKLEIHHVRKLKDLKGKRKWEIIMIGKQRKTLALCKQCHVDLHAGKLD